MVCPRIPLQTSVAKVEFVIPSLAPIIVDLLKDNHTDTRLVGKHNYVHLSTPPIVTLSCETVD